MMHALRQAIVARAQQVILAHDHVIRAQWKVILLNSHRHWIVTRD